MNIDQANAAFGLTSNEGKSDAAALANTYEDFLTLLTTQLQHQDPLSPTDSTEFTNQLVSFTGVEQSIATNDNLKALIDLQSINQQNDESTTLINYLGHTVGANTTIGKYESGDANWNLDFSVAADTVNYEIYNASGALVYSMTDVDGVSRGAQTFSWDGKYNSGADATEDDLYFLVVDATTDGGSTVNVDYKFEGLAERVETMNGAPVLMVNNMPIALSEIISVQLSETTNTGN